MSLFLPERCDDEESDVLYRFLHLPCKFCLLIVHKVQDLKVLLWIPRALIIKASPILIPLKRPDRRQKSIHPIPQCQLLHLILRRQRRPELDQY